MLAALTVRIFIEEATLRKGLPGYAEYAARVPYRPIPGRVLLLGHKPTNSIDDVMSTSGS